MSSGPTSSQVTLQWRSTSTSSAGLTYTLQRSTSSSGTYTNVTGCENTALLYCTDTTVIAGSTYYYEVFATDSSSGTVSPNSLPSDAVDIPGGALTAPGAPTVSAGPTSSQVTMQWIAASGGTAPLTYTLQRATASGGPYSDVVGCVNISTLSCIDSTVSAGTTYYYEAYATDATPTQSANSSASAAVNILPATPTAPTVSAGPTSSQVTMQWTAASGAATYTLQRATASGGPYSNVVGCVATASLSCVDNTVSSGTTYYYEVYATSSGSANSSNSSASSAVVIPSGPLTAPGAPTVSAGPTSSQVTMQWIAASGGTAPLTYTLQRATASGGPYSDVVGCVNISTLSCIDSTVSAGTTYYYEAYATDATPTQSANSSASAAVNILPATPTAPTVSAGPTSSQVTMQWTAASGAATYTLQRATASGGPYSNVVGCVATASLSCVDNTVSSGTTYYYEVYATSSGSANSSNSSASAAVNILPATPTAPTVSAGPTSSQVTMQWTATSGAVTYTLQRATASGGPYSNVVGCVATASLSCVDNTVSSGTTYYYEVYATSSGSANSSNSSASAAVNILPDTPSSAPTVSAGPTSSQVTMQWTATSGAATYTLQRATASGGPYSNVVGCVATASLSCVDNTVSAGTSYYYEYFATSSGSANSSNSPASSVVNIPTSPLTAPGTPTLVSNTNSQVVITTSTAATGGTAPYTYTFQHATASGGPYTTICSGVAFGANCTDTSTTPGNTYYYEVFATDSTPTNSSNSSFLTVSVPAAPTSLAFSSASFTSSSVPFSWSAAANNSTYTLGRSTTSGGPYTNVTGCIGVATTSCSDTSGGITLGTTYYYVVTSTSTDGAVSSYSNQLAVNFPTQPVMDPLPAHILGDWQITISLNAAVSGGLGTISYTYQQDGSDISGCTNLNSSTSCFVMPAITHNTGIYTFQMFAIDSTTGAYTASSTAIFDSSSGAFSGIFVQPIPKAPTPSTLAGDFNSSHVKMTWDSEVNAISYTLQRARALNEKYINVTGCSKINNLFCTDSSVVAGSKYFYKIVANLNYENKIASPSTEVNIPLPAYISSNNPNNIYVCNTDANFGTLSSCLPAELKFSYTFNSLIHNIAVSKNYAIITNKEPSVTICELNNYNNIGFSSCIDTPTPQYLAHVTIFNNYFYYINHSSNQIISCPVDDLSFTNCSSIFNSNYPITSYNLNNEFAFFKNNYSLSGCIVNKNSKDNHICNNNITNFNSIKNIALKKINNKTYSYITYENNNNIDVCLVSNENASLTQCTRTAFKNNSFYSFNNPNSVTINNNFAYILDDSDNNTIVCYIDNSSGNLTSCKPSSINAIINKPTSITFQK